MFDLSEWASLNLDGSLRGQEFSAKCPFCGRHGKFSLNIEKGKFRCFRASCQAGGVTKLVSHVEGISWSEARKKTNEVLDVQTPAYEKTKAFERPKFEVPLPDEFTSCYKAGRDPEYRIPRYLRERECNETLKKFEVGFCTKGKYFNRVILPVKCPNGYAYTARDATDDWKTDERRPKYLNPPGEWKNALLYGWNQYAESLGQDLVLVEGPFDVLRLHSHGIPAMSILGKELGAGQRALLHTLPRSTSVTIMIDPEERSFFVRKIALEISLHFKNIYVAKLEPGIDPGISTSEQAFTSIDSARKFK